MMAASIAFDMATASLNPAVRELYRSRGGPILGAADIVLEDGAGGSPVVSGGWNGRLPVLPRIAIAASGDLTLALAWDGPAGKDLEFDAQEILNHALALCQPATGETHERHP